MNETLERLRVLLRAAPTYLSAAAAIVTILISELAVFEDLGPVVRILGYLATVLAVSISIVRRVTPVVSAERGLLPPPSPPTS